MHSGQVDEHVVLVCRPHAEGTLDGMLYYAGDPMGELEDGTIVGDSLYFNIRPFEFRGRRDGDQMALEEVDGSTLSLQRRR
jgi:hypothetical protein